MKAISILMVLFVLGCATAVPRPATVTEFRLSKNKGDTFKAVGQALLSNGFSITLTDHSIGVIKAQKEFYVKRGIMKVDHPAKAAVQVMLTDEGKAIIQTQYECRYGLVYQNCPLNDKEANPAIQEIEKIVQADLARAFAAK